MHSGAVQHGQQNRQRSIGGGDSAKKDTQKTFCKFGILRECCGTTLYIKPHASQATVVDIELWAG